MKQKSKRWNVLVGNYKGEKNITASPVQILTSLELVHEYAAMYGDSDGITPHMKEWVVQRTGCTPTLAYDALIYGVEFNNWLAERNNGKG